MRPTIPANQGRLITLAGVAVIIAGLHFARDVLIPIALAVLLAFLLAPLVRRLEALRLPRTPAVMLVSALCFAVIGLLGYVIARQGLDLTARLPEYRQNIVEKIRSLKPAGDDPISRAIDTIENIEKEVTEEDVVPAGDAAAEGPAGTGRAATGERASGAREAGGGAREPPVPVEIVQRSNFIEQVSAMAGGLLGPLATAGIVIVLVIFFLLSRDDLRDRVIQLLGRSDVNVTTRALEDAGSRVSRYLVMQLIVNTIYAIPVAIGLSLLEVPNALMWAVLGLLLRFVPYVGPLIAAGMPIMLSLAHFDGWTTPMIVVGMYVVIETVINNAVEPWLYGSSTGMSSVAVIVSALFWTWLWGPIGLLMATPLTATLVAFGRHTPQLQYLSVLLGDTPVGERSTRFYQRLIALDQDGATDLAEEAFDERGSAVDVCDELVLPALRQAHQAHQEDQLGDQRLALVDAHVEAIVDLLTERDAEPPGQADAAGIDALHKRSLARAAVLCMPARDESDRLPAQALAELLATRGYRADTTEPGLLVSDRVAAVAAFEPDVVVISALPPYAHAQSRHLSKRLQARFPELEIVIGAWLSGGDRPPPRRRPPGGQRLTVVTSFADAIHHIEALSRGLPPREAESDAAAAAATADPAVSGEV